MIDDLNLPYTINTFRLIISYLKLQDTFSSSKITVGASNSNMRIFLCGPTVYDYCHIGHARIFILFDVLSRFLKSNNIKVIISSPYFSTSSSDVVAKQTGVKVLTMATSTGAFPTVKNYFDVFDYDINQLTGALK